MSNRRKFSLYLNFIFAVLALLSATSVAATLSIEKSDFGTTRAKDTAYLYTLTNPAGMIAKVSTYGALLVELDVPDKAGRAENVVLSYKTLAEYERNGAMFGAIVGRFANRIEGAKFTIDGKEYNVTKNSGQNHIHGGRNGFNRVMWKPETSQTDKSVSLVLTYHSADGEEGYPGNMDVTVTYTLTTDNELKLDYAAVTDKPTVINMTNHSYFNLNGNPATPIANHVLTINADIYTPVNQQLIPSGEFKPVKDLPIDFTKPAPVGERAAQMKNPPYFDTGFVINDGGKGKSIMCAKAVEPTSGRTMEVWTTQPGVQLYTGNARGLCLETQHYPNSPNRPEFPTTVLRPGEKFSQSTVFKFSVSQ